MTSGESNGKRVDFQLVSTYVPVIQLVARAMVLVLLFQVAHSVGHDHTGLCVLVCVLCYFDGYCYRTDALNRAAGFLVPPAFYMYTHAPSQNTWVVSPVSHCTQMPVLVFYWAVDLLWASSSSMLIASLLCKIRVKLRIQTVACVWSFILLVHVALRCYHPPGFWEIVLRVLLYYVSCVCYFFTSSFVLDTDRHTHTFTVMHVCLHILFVEPFVLVASVVVSGGIYAKLYIYHMGYTHCKHCPEPPPSPAVHEPSVSVSVTGHPKDDLLAQLRAAQARV